MTYEEAIIAHQYTYTVNFEPEPDAGFVVTCGALPGLVTYGETLEEARSHATEAIMGYLEALRHAGQAIPASTDDTKEPHREPLTVTLNAV